MSITDALVVRSPALLATRSTKALAKVDVNASVGTHLLLHETLKKFKHTTQMHKQLQETQAQQQTQQLQQPQQLQQLKQSHQTRDKTSQVSIDLPAMAA